ncbi:CIA30 family protein [Herpetosiphon llansteffanensis]
MVVEQKSTGPLAELLTTLLRQRQLSPRRLAELTNIPEDTIKGWLLGRGRSIREWERAIVVVAVLDLAYASTIEFLSAARVAPASLERIANTEFSAAYREQQRLIVDWEARHEIIKQLRTSTLQPATTPLPAQSEAPVSIPAVALAAETPPSTPIKRRWPVWAGVGLAMLVVGIGIWWWLRPQPLRVWTAGGWGEYTDNDVGGNSQAINTPFVCIIPESKTNQQLIAGCRGFKGIIRGQDGYAGIYRTLSDPPKQTVDWSQVKGISFWVYGSGQHVHIGIEAQPDPNQPPQEHIAKFEIMPTWQQVYIPLSMFVPLEPGTTLDLSKIHALSWSITQGDQPHVELLVDRIQLEY